MTSDIPALTDLTVAEASGWAGINRLPDEQHAALIAWLDGHTV